MLESFMSQDSPEKLDNTAINPQLQSSQEEAAIHEQQSPQQQLFHQIAKQQQHSHQLNVSEDAINLLAEFLEVEFRMLCENVLSAAKIRQRAHPPPSEGVVVNDVRKQLAILDSYYHSQDLKNSSSEEARKILATKATRKRDFAEAQNDTNATALAAIGGKKRYFNASSSAAVHIPRPSTTNVVRAFQITSSDVLFAIEQDATLQNTWVHRNALYLNSFPGYDPFVQNP